MIPHVHAASHRVLRLALVGCGGRGTGAAANALAAGRETIHLTAMADLFDGRLINSHNSLRRQFGDRIDVPAEARHIGFDAYQRAMADLTSGDLVILAAPPAFRWLHFAHAIAKGIHVFMEPPLSVDGPTTRRMLDLAQQSKVKGLKVAVGLMLRHCRARRELQERIQNGEIGDVRFMRSYRMHGPMASAFVRPRRDDTSELLWQIRNFQSFLWASGGLFSDFYIHKIDECCWMKNGWPVQVRGVGGRHYRGDKVDQNFDHYAVEYDFEDASQFSFHGRTMVGSRVRYASYAHGTGGMAIVSSAGNYPARCRIYRGHDPASSAMAWSYPEAEQNPFALEWEDFLAAIRDDTPYHEVEQGAMASLVTAMGRMAAHTGQVITLDQMLNHEHEFAPGIDRFTMDAPPPLAADSDGCYPTPMPGIKLTREF